MSLNSGNNHHKHRMDGLETILSSLDSGLSVITSEMKIEWGGG